MMFESALVDSGNRIQTRSRYWMLATTSFNAAIVAAIVLIPMLYPEALPRTQIAAMLQPPTLPHAATPKPPAAQPMRTSHAVAALNPMVAPPRIPAEIRPVTNDAPPQLTEGVALGSHSTSTGTGVPFSLASASPMPVITVAPRKPTIQHVSGGVVAGLNISKTTPAYPPIARAAHVSGTVELHAIISKTGTIENLTVLSGPEMLRGAALDAVKTWRYRPYLLNGEPVPVDTTITVNFTMGS